MELRELLLMFGGSLEKKGGEEQLSGIEKTRCSRIAKTILLALVLLLWWRVVSGAGPIVLTSVGG